MYKLKYILEFNNVRVEILENTEDTLVPVYLEGGESPVIFDAPEQESRLATICGSALSLRLIATETFTLEDLFTEDETKLLVNLYINEEIEWRGFISPDGAVQSFVNSIWEIEIDCVDGLGRLKNLAFVDHDTGENFNGRMTYLKVIYNCLRRTAVPDMELNTKIDIYYEGLLPPGGTNPGGVDILGQSEIEVERFYKNDEETPMDCYEVLDSVLKEFKAVIRQRGGNWYVFRPNDSTSESQTFFRYKDGIRQAQSSVLQLRANLGSWINGSYPHHAGENQQIYIEKAYKVLTINYQFGTVKSLIENPNFLNWTSVAPAGWSVTPGTSIQKYYLPQSGLYAGVRFNTGFNTGRYMYYGGVLVQQGDLLNFRLVVDKLNEGNVSFPGFSLVVRSDSDMWRLRFVGDGSGMYWEQNGNTIMGQRITQESTIELNAPPLPITGTLSVELYGDDNNFPIIYKHASLTPRETSVQPVKGEFHTVTNNTGNYSYVPDNEVVFNGDGQSSLYVGTIYKPSGAPTSKWSRLGKNESLPLIGIAAQDLMRMHQRQYRKFTGGFFGYFPYLSFVTIDSFSGSLFLPTAMRFDFKSGTGEIVLQEILTEEMNLSYEVNNDYGQTIKPVIR